MTRKLLIVLGLAGALVLGAAPAHAQEVTPEDGVAELDESRALIDESLDLYEREEIEAAYTAARDPYFDNL